MADFVELVKKWERILSRRSDIRYYQPQPTDRPEYITSFNLLARAIGGNNANQDAALAIAEINRGRVWHNYDPQPRHIAAADALREFKLNNARSVEGNLKISLE